MSYITTNHQFVIDEKHPADVFGEMANFFSLYTVALDAIHRMSIQLNVPANFDIEGNQKLYDSYQQFIKAVRYSLPDINVLPIQQSESDSPSDNITLMIQYFEGRVTDDVHLENGTETVEPKPKFYQKILGGLLPKFASDTTTDGLYPEPVVPTISMPTPAPVSQPIPVAQPIPVSQPQAISTPQQPTPQPVPVQPAVAQPVPPVITPQPLPQPQHPQPQQPTIQQPPRPISTPTQNPVLPATPTPALTPITPKIVLPKPSKSIRPYREILIQAILAEVQTQQAQVIEKASQPITAITFKSRDSLTTAFIETVFASFSPTQNNSQISTLGRAGDAIDLASFGLEELRPKLSKIGVALSDDAQFLLNSKAKARPEDIALIQQGQLEPNAVNLGVQLDYAQSRHLEKANPQFNPTPKTTTQKVQPNTNTLNANRFNIAINVKVSDNMGERTVKLREFPAVFSTQNTHANSAKLIKVVTHQAQGELFYLAEQDGQLLAQAVASEIVLHRNGQASSLYENDILLPNDVLQMGDVQIRLLLS